MSCHGSRLLSSKRHQKVSVLWNGNESIEKNTKKKGNMPRYTIALSNKARKPNDSMATGRQSASPCSELPRQDWRPSVDQGEEKQRLRIVLSKKNLLGSQTSNLQIDIINSRFGKQAINLQQSQQQPEFNREDEYSEQMRSPAYRQKIPRTALNTASKQNMHQSSISSSIRKKIFPLGNSKIAMSRINHQQSKAETLNRSSFDRPLTESKSQTSFISKNFPKQIEPMILSRVSEHHDPNRLTELSSFPMLEKKLLDTSAHHSSLQASAINVPAKPPGKENSESSRKKIFVHPIKVKRSNGQVTSMKPPPTESSYSLEARVLQSIHSLQQQQPIYQPVRRRLPAVDISDHPILPGCCL